MEEAEKESVLKFEKVNLDSASQWFNNFPISSSVPLWIGTSFLLMAMVNVLGPFDASFNAMYSDKSSLLTIGKWKYTSRENQSSDKNGII